MITKNSREISKTIITSPINGIINSAPVSLNDLVSPGQLLTTVVNDKALRVRSSVSADNLKTLQIGNEVLIREKTKGELTRIAPAINPLNNQAEIIITITDNLDNVIAGEFVDLVILSNQAQNKNFLIPLSSVKTTRESSLSYLLDKDNKIITKEITLGKILGEDVEVSFGLDAKDKIIESVRGLEPGTKVKTEF